MLLLFYGFDVRMKSYVAISKIVQHDSEYLSISQLYNMTLDDY